MKAIKLTATKQDDARRRRTPSGQPNAWSTTLNSLQDRTVQGSGPHRERDRSGSIPTDRTERDAFESRYKKPRGNVCQGIFSIERTHSATSSLHSPGKRRPLPFVPRFTLPLPKLDGAATLWTWQNRFDQDPMNLSRFCLQPPRGGDTVKLESYRDSETSAVFDKGLMR